MSHLIQWLLFMSCFFDSQTNSKISVPGSLQNLVTLINELKKDVLIEVFDFDMLSYGAHTGAGNASNTMKY